MLAGLLGVAAGTGGCVPGLGDHPHIVDFVWLPAGDIVYQQSDSFDDPDLHLVHRDHAGHTSPLTVDARPLTGDCQGRDPQLFVAPDGGLGLEYNCDRATELTEYASGQLRKLGELPAEMGRFAAEAGTSLSGLVGASMTSYAGGLCMGLRQVNDGKPTPPFGTVASHGRSVALSLPTEPIDCDVPMYQTAGPFLQAVSRDGSYWTFAIPSNPPPSDPAASPTPQTEVDQIWVWPAGAATPTAVGPLFAGVDSISPDPQGHRVALSFLFAGGRGVKLLDLDTGATTQLLSGHADNVAFSPDGSQIAYIDGSHDLSFHTVTR